VWQTLKSTLQVNRKQSPKKLECGAYFNASDNWALENTKSNGKTKLLGIPILQTSVYSTSITSSTAANIRSRFQQHSYGFSPQKRNAGTKPFAQNLEYINSGYPAYSRHLI